MNNWLNGLFIRFKAKSVGKDEFGNEYFESKKIDRSSNRKKRWILYSGLVEASKVPGHWFNWLHYQCDTPPKSNEALYAWEKEHTPNLTGTHNAYFPQGHAFSGAKRAKATGDYESWNPNQ